MNIFPIQPTSIQPMSSPIDIAGPASSSGTSDFGSILQGAINQVEGAGTNANQSVQNFLSGDGDDLHSTVLAVQRANLEFDMLMQVRNKVVSAYQEIMKMQM